MQCPAAVHFVEKNGSVIGYGIQTNSTSLQKRGRFEDPTLSFQIPLQLAAEREIARYLIGGIIIKIKIKFFFYQKINDNFYITMTKKKRVDRYYQNFNQ